MPAKSKPTQVLSITVNASRLASRLMELDNETSGIIARSSSVIGIFGNNVVTLTVHQAEVGELPKIRPGFKCVTKTVKKKKR